jgi:hypothetical protein
MGLLSNDGEIFDNAFSMVQADRCGVAAKSPVILNGLAMDVNLKINKRLLSRKSLARNMQTQGSGEKARSTGSGLGS